MQNPNQPGPSRVSDTTHTHISAIKPPSGCHRFLNYVYNRQTRTCCDRSCTSWLAVICYVLMYFLFLCTYTMMFLYVTLIIIKNNAHNSKASALVELLVYPEHGIGLTATPTAENNYPLIWYREGVSEDYDKYVKALDNLLATHRTKGNDNAKSLGPCGKSPYGYGDKPCVIIRINKQYKWAEAPLTHDSPKAKEAPEQVKKWMQADNKKYWLYCNGDHSYDKEHIGSIKYYPDPPGFDSTMFPLPLNSSSPMVALQISNFTHGISLVIECKLWYANGVSTFDFILYVMPKNRRIILRTEPESHNHHNDSYGFFHWGSYHGNKTETNASTNNISSNHDNDTRSKRITTKI